MLCVLEMLCGLTSRVLLCVLEMLCGLTGTILFCVLVMLCVWTRIDLGISQIPNMLEYESIPSQNVHDKTKTFKIWSRDGVQVSNTQHCPRT